MGNLTPILGTLTQTLGAIETISSSFDTLTGQERRQTKAQQDLAMRNLQASQNQSVAEAREKAEADRKRLQIDAKAQEKRRRDSLRRAVARQNVNRGAGGISSTGSSEAVLLGLYNDTDDDRSYSSALDQLRYNSIDSNLSNLQSRNILERSQLAARQKLEREISGY